MANQKIIGHAHARLIILPGLHGQFIGTAEGGGEATVSKTGMSLPEITAALVGDFLAE